MKVKRLATLLTRAQDEINLLARTGGSAYRIRLIRSLRGVWLIDSIERSICAIYLKIEVK